MFHLAWVISGVASVQRLVISSQDEAQDLFANLRGRETVTRGSLYWVTDGTYELVESFGFRR